MTQRFAKKKVREMMKSKARTMFKTKLASKLYFTKAPNNLNSSRKIKAVSAA